MLTSEINVHKILHTIKATALGIDQIILYTINFPKLWKYSLIKSIPKCSNHQELKKLHPIKILPRLLKIFEQVICSQLYQFVKDNQLLFDFLNTH